MTTVTEDLRKEVISSHPAYPGHKLKRVVAAEEETFTCDGCIIPGAGARYLFEHEGRSLDHHICCAVAPVSQPNLTHPNFGDLAFLRVPPERTDGERRVCGEAVHGFVCHCSGGGGRGVTCHPCCALQSCKCTVPVPE